MVLLGESVWNAREEGEGKRSTQGCVEFIGGERCERVAECSRLVYLISAFYTSLNFFFYITFGFVDILILSYTELPGHSLRLLKH